MNIQTKIENAKVSGILDIRGMKLTSFPYVLPDNLTEFNCSNNMLNSLPDLPSSLKRLNCRNNYLYSLPVLPRSLSFLDCSKNYLESLPPLKDIHNLTHIVCSENMLSTLPEMPSSLKCFSCHTNQLTKLPEFPDSLILLWAQYNARMDSAFKTIAYNDDPICALKTYFTQKKERMEYARYIIALIHIFGRKKNDRLSDDILNRIGAQFSCCDDPLKIQLARLKQYM